MNKQWVFLFCVFHLLLIFSHVYADPETTDSTLPSPQLEQLNQHLHFLSADELKGRETGTDEVDVASRYISSRLRSWGLQPGVSMSEGASYFQRVPLKKSVARARLTVSKPSSNSSAQINAPLYSRIDVNPAVGGVERPVVFAGYGITDPERGYNDYRDLEVAGKFVVIFRHEPNESDPDSKFDGTSWTKGARFRQKYRTAKEHGAAGVFLINDPLGHHEGFPRVFGTARWTLVEEQKGDEGEANHIPFVGLSPAKGAKLLGVSRSELKELQKKIDRGPEPQSYELSGRRVSVSIESKTSKTNSARNVIARLSGSGSNKEHIVIGAHYDHIGTRSEGEDRVYNGANDNASGTAAVLELARLFSKRNQRPERTLIFVLFAAEEVGLFGSRYYVQHPVLPLQHTSAMVNFDMVGRNNGNVSVHGAKNNVIFKRMNDVLDRKMPDTRFKSLGLPDALSDHTSFSRQDIPVLFYFTGLNENYHDVTDEVDAVNISGLQEIVHHASMMIDKLSAQSVQINDE